MCPLQGCGHLCLIYTKTWTDGSLGATIINRFSSWKSSSITPGTLESHSAFSSVGMGSPKLRGSNLRFQRRQWHPTPVLFCLENPMDGGAWWAAVHGVAKSQTWLSDFPFTFHFHTLEKEMATHSSVLAWRIPGMGEPGGLPSMRMHRVGHDWVTSLSLFTFMHWRRKWQLTPVFLPGESQGWGSLVGCHLWGHTESDRNEVT